MYKYLNKMNLEQCFSTLVISVFVYHECTMRRHAEMGDVLTGKQTVKKNVEYTNKILFHLYQDSADCQFSRKKTQDLRIYDLFAINKIKLKFY